MPNSLPILIVGGFASSWQSYGRLQRMIGDVSGRAVAIAPIALFDWVGVIASGGYSTLLQLLDQAVNKMLAESGREQLVILAHSAGGVLARIFMGDRPYGSRKLVFNGFERVATLVTLGTPHRTVGGGRAGGLDQIMFAQQHYPGAYWRFVRYVTIMGRGVFGVKDGTPAQRGAWQSYRLISGQGDLWGDGVVPVEYGLLDNARHVVLEGLCHHPRADQIWYGQNEATVRGWWSIVEDEERRPTRGSRTL